MTDINTNMQGMQGEEKEDMISVMEIVTLFIKHWKWIFFGLIIALAVAFVYLRYTTPVYRVASSVVLKEVGRRGPSAMPGTLEEIAMMGSVSNMENELYILKSRSMIRSVINRLDLHTSYIVEGRVKSTDLYKQSPVIVDMAQSDLDLLRETIRFEMQMESEERVHIRGTVAGNALDTIFTQLPAVILTDVGAISFTRRHEIKPDNRLLYVSIQHPDAVIGTYRGNLEVAQASRQATVINLALNTPYTQKGRDFINTLIEVYNNEAIEDKNQEARNTQQFIEERIAIDEAFRMLRTNLLLTLGADNKVVTCTSTVSGEGKTFIALNTAISLSLLNKRVLLVGLDLRIPRLREYMNLETRDGITSYLSGFEKDLDRLIVPSGITENLFALPSGAIPPNPAELLSRPSLDAAFAKLREVFDYILIDSAPVSQVTDTLILNRVSDATIYVCRANYSSKGNLRFANDMMAQNRLKNMVLVVNDVDEFHHAYGYGYGRGYGYGYGKKKKKK